MFFSKYQGCGNDFIIGEYQEDVDYSKVAYKVCNRYTGIGADGLILAKSPKPYEMVFYNADGSRAPMCGNGIRCLCAFLRDNKLDLDNEMIIKTLSGIRKVKYKDGLFTVDMGNGQYDNKILDIVNNPLDTYLDKKIEYCDQTFICSAIYMTTHHLVCLVDDLNISSEIGKYLCTYKDFSKGINVNFVKIIDKNTICVRTYERGVGWTKACGSGSTASFVILNNKRLVNNYVNVILEYGKLNIYKENNSIFMKGPATLVASKINYNDIY